MFQTALERIRHHSRNKEILVLAPTLEAARHLVRSACDGALIGVHPCTPRQYARDLTRSGATAINRIVHQAICTRIARTAKLTYFAPVANMPGFPKALARTIHEVRMHGARPAGDVGVLLAEYERELSERGLADDAAMYSMARSSGVVPMPSLTFAVDTQWNAEQQFLSWLQPLESFQPTAPETPADALQSVQRYLFSEEAPPTRSADVSFQVFGVATESQECIEIARAILARRARFDECAVLLRQPERYAPLIAEAFRRTGVPVWFARGTRSPDVAGRALLVLLHCAHEGLSAARMGEYLSLRHVPEMNPAGWERIVTNAHVLGGAERWQRRLNAVARKSQALEELKAFVLPLVDRLQSLPRTALWGEWLDALGELVESAVRDNDEVLEALDQLRPMNDIGPVGIEDVILLLSEHLGTSRTRSDEERYGRVWIGSIEEARGFNFRHVFVPGVAEGAFPRARREDPLLLDEERRQLGMREATEQEEQQLLADAALSATDSLTLSYGRIDLETGRPRVPSLYIYAALRAAGGGTEITPPHTSDPVDDFEYDTRALTSRTPGSGAYLKRANSHLYEALLARFRRWDNDHKWHNADGLNIIDPSLDEYRPTQHAYSVSALETYASCPYRFFLKAILRLYPIQRPEPLQRMESSLRGEIFHEVQREVLRELKQNSATNLDAVLARVAAGYAERLAPAVQQVWNDELRRIQVDLRGWLDRLTTDDAAWTPIAFELAFGRKRDESHDELSVDEPVSVLDGYLLQGSVDLVERHVSGQLRVTDHKTGALLQPLPRTVGKGEVLQPALYALAVEKILGEPVTSARLYHATLKANFKSAALRVPNDNTVHVMGAIDQAISNGLLPANPREDACTYCDYRPICGPYEEQRVRRKPKDAKLEFIRKCE